MFLVFANTRGDAKVVSLIYFGGHAIMEREHARAGRDFGDCLAEPFNLPGENTKGRRAVATCSGPTSKGLAQLEPNPGFLDPQT